MKLIELESPWYQLSNELLFKPIGQLHQKCQQFWKLRHNPPHLCAKVSDFGRQIALESPWSKLSNELLVDLIGFFYGEHHLNEQVTLCQYKKGLTQTHNEATKMFEHLLELRIRWSEVGGSLHTITLIWSSWILKQRLQGRTAELWPRMRRQRCLSIYECSDIFVASFLPHSGPESSCSALSPL